MPSKLADGPSVKRQKLHNQVEKITTNAGPRSSSRIFAPFRTLGLVSPTSVPFTSIPLGKATFQITTCVGRCLQTYDLKRGLHLVFMTRPQTPGPITATVAWADRVLAAWSEESNHARGVWIFKRGRKVGELEFPANIGEDVVEFVIFGSWIVGCCATKIAVWKAESGEHYTTLLPGFQNGARSGNVLTGGICSVPTYTNKILAGRENGCVEIWNISTGKLIFTIQPPTSDTGPVTALEPTPALSLVAIAYYSGLLIIHDILVDRTIIKINAGSGDQLPVTSIAFRSDGRGVGSDGREAGMMATASYNSGDVVLWDLNRGARKIGTLRNAHRPPTQTNTGADGGISKIEFLPNQAILLTSGLDNALRSWIFDETPYSPIPRALHSRSGHAAPVTRLDFIPAESDGSDIDGKWLLSASKDRSLWGWSIRRDGQSTELSQGSIAKKAKQLGLGSQSGSTNRLADPDELRAPEITCMACCLNRDGGIATLPGVRSMWTSAKQLKGKGTETEQNITGWESIVTGHAGDKFARTWFWGRKRAGRWVLETGDGAPVASVALSPCGTFTLVGSEAGGIDMFNLQSGLRRQRFPARLSKAEMARRPHASATNGVARGTKQPWSKGEGKHTGAVIGLQVDGLNQTVISAGADGKVKFWDFSTGLLSDQISWSANAAPERMVYHRPNDLIAISCVDLHIRVVDIESRKLVRDLSGHKGAVTDLCFSADGRWIIAASSDSTIRVWDLPTGHLIDALGLPSSCSALAFSSTGEYLAVARSDRIGVDLWTNKTFFTHVPTSKISPETVFNVEGPAASGEGGQNILDSANTVSAGADEDDDEQLALQLGTSLGPSEVDQLSKDVMTLSLVPRSRWQTLINLDLVRERNKPIEPPKAPEKAPFFLPSLLAQNASSNDGVPRPLITDSLTPSLQTATSSTALVERSRILSTAIGSRATPFTTLLVSGAKSGSYDDFVEHFKTLPPSQADLEIRSLSIQPPYDELRFFVDALAQRILLKRDFELVNAWMKVFLNCHAEVVQEVITGIGNSTGAAAEEAVGADGTRPRATQTQNLQMIASRGYTVADADADADGDGEVRAVAAAGVGTEDDNSNHNHNHNDEDEDEESKGAKRLLDSLQRWRAVQRAEKERLNRLLGFCSGVLSFLRSSR